MRTPTIIVALAGLAVASCSAFGQCSPPFVVTDFGLEQPNLALNGSAQVNGTRLVLTPSASGQAGSAWWVDPVTIRNGFFSQFVFTLDGSSDGIAFVIQTDGLGALGGTGSGLGYAGIPRSLAIEIDTFSFGGGSELEADHASIFTEGVDPNDSSDFNYLNWGPIPFDVNDGQPHLAEIRYDGSNLALLIDGYSITGIAVDLEDILGASILDPNGCAYVGLTGATGGAVAEQAIESWSINDQVPAPCSTDLNFTALGAQGWITEGSAGFEGTEIVLTQPVSGQSGAAWWQDTVRLRDGFEVEFDFVLDGTGDGIAFVIQSQALDALGSGGSGIGYGTNGGPGVFRSLAVEFDTFSFGAPFETPEDHVAVHTQGINANSPDDAAAIAIAELGYDINDSGPHTALIRYQDGFLTVSVDGLEWISTPVDLENIDGSSILYDSGCAFIGFTGATGAAVGRQAIQNLRFTSNPGGGGCTSVDFTQFVSWFSPVEVGSRIEWTFNGTGTGPLSWFWRLDGVDVVNDGVISGAGTRTLVIDPVGPEHAGQWDYGLFNDCSGVGTGFYLEVIEPCLSDYTRDGGVDGDDVIAFFADWDLGLIEADVTRDGGVDGDDVILFFERWDSGC
jgi:hypothetical protein